MPSAAQGHPRTVFTGKVKHSLPVATDTSSGVAWHKYRHRGPDEAVSSVMAVNGAKIVPATELTSAERLLFESRSSSSDLPLPLAHLFKTFSFIALRRAAVPPKRSKDRITRRTVCSWRTLVFGRNGTKCHCSMSLRLRQGAVATQNGDDQPDKKRKKKVRSRCPVAAIYMLHPTSTSLPADSASLIGLSVRGRLKQRRHQRVQDVLDSLSRPQECLRLLVAIGAVTHAYGSRSRRGPRGWQALSPAGGLVLHGSFKFLLSRCRTSP